MTEFDWIFQESSLQSQIKGLFISKKKKNILVLIFRRSMLMVIKLSVQRLELNVFELTT